MNPHALQAPAPTRTTSLQLQTSPPTPSRPPNPPRRHPHDPFEWRHWKSLDIHPSAASDARRMVTQQLANHGYPSDLGEDAESIVSELVANALASAMRGQERGLPPAVVVAVSGVGAEVCLSVYDSDPTPPPSVWIAADEDEHGRGLTIVGELSDIWGWSRGDITGKYIWAVLRANAKERKTGR